MENTPWNKFSDSRQKRTTEGISRFKPEPVDAEQLLAWEVAPPEVFLFLKEAVLRKKRILISGGDCTGKTTLLSVLVNFIPPEQPVVMIENPDEIKADRPRVVSRKVSAPVGTKVFSYGNAAYLNRIMRTGSHWIIVDEVCKGEMLLPLFRAMEDGHEGMLTLHVDNWEYIPHILSMMLFNAHKIGFREAKKLFMDAVDLVVQLGWTQQGKRKIVGIWVVDKGGLRNGEVGFAPLWLSPLLVGCPAGTA